MMTMPWAAVALIFLLLSGCAPSADPTLPEVIVHKSASCSCCKVWAQHLRDAGFPVVIRNSDDLSPVKRRLHVPSHLGSCHTAEVGGYFVEGHVPAQDIVRLLRERPVAKGLAVPGMPLGSPGMEAPPNKIQEYEVVLVTGDDRATTFSRHNARQGGQK